MRFLFELPWKYVGSERREKCDLANTSRQVKSQTIHLPFFQWIRDTPSGLFKSDLDKPHGSRMEGTWAEESPLWMMELTYRCFESLPALLTQLRPCLHLVSTDIPQKQECSLQTSQPKRRATAIRS